jgi:hypothetical protein
MTADNIYSNEMEDREEARRSKELKDKYLSSMKGLKLTPEQQEFWDTKLSSKLYRMNNYYTILDKEGVKKIMVLNAAQSKILTKFRHNKKIIPKSRQQGISTLFVAYNLDDCMFKPGFQAGIQSYGQDESDKLQKRALLMWNDLDQNIKDLLNIRLVSSNQKGMTFSNGSVLKIGNFRGDTLQSLHVSELAKIAKKYPEKARELKTGAFQAVSKNSKITVESTAEGADGLFYEICMQAQALQQMGVELTPLDFELIFIGWTEDPDCSMVQTPNIPQHKRYLIEELEDYFISIEKLLNLTLTKAQKNWYIAKKIELGDDMKQEYPATLEEAFEQSVHGTIYKKEYDSIVLEHRIQPNLFRPHVPTTVSYDIGVNDETVLTFMQIHKGRPSIVNVYAASGESLEHYVAVMEALVVEKHYNITDVLLPHDANVRDFSTGRTRLERFRELGVPCRLIKRQSIDDGIEATRQLLKVIWIDSSLEKFISAIQLYRWKIDTKLDVTLRVPLHDWCSNYMDSLKYMAQGVSFDETVYDPYEENEIEDYEYEGV